MSQNNNQNPQNGESPTSSEAVLFNPYSILNVSNHATIEEIQKSYKLLSRSFHPDKQPIDNRDDAQTYFIQLKSAYDILMDPTLKFVLDHFGYEGVTFLKRQGRLYQEVEGLLKQRRDEFEQRFIDHTNHFTTKEDEKKDEQNSYFNVLGVGILPSNQELEQRAIQIFSEAVQNYNFQMSTMKSKKPIITGSVKVNCNTTHSTFLEEGIEPLSLDVDETKLAFTISQSHRQISSQSLTRKQNMKVSCSASSTVKSTSGEGLTSGQLSVEYEPVQGTEVHANLSSDFDMTAILDEEEDNNNDDGGAVSLDKRFRKQQQKRQVQPKLEIGTSRIFTNRTYVHANLSAPITSYIRPICYPQHIKVPFMKSSRLNKSGTNGGITQSDFMLSLTTHRSLFQDKIRCTWIAGLALPDMKLQYGMISISTNNFQTGDDEDDTAEEEEEEASKDQQDESENNGQQKQNKKSQSKRNKQSKPPKHTLKLNLGMSHTPISLTTEKDFSETHSGIASVGYGTVGWDLKVISTRAISKLCKLSLGVRHVGTVGFSTLFKIQRGSMNFTVPVLVTTSMSPSFALKSMYISMLMTLFDQMIGDFVNDSYSYLSNDQKNTGAKAKLSLQKTKEDFLFESEKLKRERLQQIELMRKTSEAKMKKEDMKDDGLVILSATYEIQHGDSINVTIPLQFWVMNSALHLPPMSKSNMLGFYNVQRGLSYDDERSSGNQSVLASWFRRLMPFRIGEEPGSSENKSQLSMVSVPTLTVRYRYGNDVYEVTILDHEELHLPCRDAMKLGGSHVK